MWREGKREKGQGARERACGLASSEQSSQATRTGTTGGRRRAWNDVRPLTRDERAHTTGVQARKEPPAHLSRAGAGVAPRSTRDLACWVVVRNPLARRRPCRIKTISEQLNGAVVYLEHAYCRTSVCIQLSRFQTGRELVLLNRNCKPRFIARPSHTPLGLQPSLRMRGRGHRLRGDIKRSTGPF